MFKKIKQKWVPVVISLIIVGLIAGLQWLSLPRLEEFLERIEYIIYDQRLKAFPLKTNSDYKITIIDVDDNSIQKEGRWPWTRKKISKLVEQLTQAGAVVVAFDMVFSDLELDARQEVIHEIKNNASLSSDEQTKLSMIVANQDPNQAFVNSIKNVDTILGFILHNQDHNPVGFLPKSYVELNTQELPLSHLKIPQLYNYTGNLAEFSQAAKSSGFISIFPDKDGVLRRAPMILRFNNSFFSSLSLEVARQFNLLEKIHVDIAEEGMIYVVDAIDLGGKKILTDGLGQVFIPYIGPKGSFPYLSAGDVIENQFDKSMIEGAIIIIGSSALGIGDLRSTPMMTGYPGVEVQANLLSGILSNNFPFQPSWAQGLNLLILLLIGFLFSCLMPFLRAVNLIVMTLIVSGSLITVNFLLWTHLAFVMPLALQIFLVLLLSIFNLAYGYFIEDKQKRNLSEMFGQYVPPEHIAQMAENSDKHYGFDGESREMTVLFCDIQDFTPIAQKMSANEIKRFLESFLTPMTEIIFKYDGTIDKYVGDMIMAFWNAPLEDTQHRAHAIGAALAMQKKLTELNQIWRAEGLTVEIGVGLNSGIMNVGDMGSEFRRSYTVIGDAVNLASRLEALTRIYQVPVLVSEYTYLEQEEYAAVWLDNVIVKGREEARATKIYYPVGAKSVLTHLEWQWLAHHEQAVDAYVNKDYPRAHQYFNQLQKTKPELHKLYDFYLKQTGAN